MTAVAHAPEMVAALGWCPRCYVEGASRPIPAAPGATMCAGHLRRLAARPVRAGQIALVDIAPIPRVMRAPQPTGQQRECVLCVAAGKPNPALGEGQWAPGDPQLLCGWSQACPSVPSPTPFLPALKRPACTPSDLRFVLRTGSDALGVSVGIFYV